MLVNDAAVAKCAFVSALVQHERAASLQPLDNPAGLEFVKRSADSAHADAKLAREIAFVWHEGAWLPRLPGDPLGDGVRDLDVERR